MNVKLYRSPVGFLVAMLWAVFLPLASSAQTSVDTWERVNRGFAKCANLNGFAGEAEWFTDDFDIRQMIHRRGEMYAYITYGNNGTNTANCGAGLFRHDTVTNRWIKVANGLSGSVRLFSNNTEIIAQVGYTANNTYRFTTDYLNNSSGWQTIGNLTWNRIPNNECRGTGISDNGVGGSIEAFVGDTIYVIQESPCNNNNQILKYYVGGNFIIEFPQDIYVEYLGDFPYQGLIQNRLKVLTHHYDYKIIEPVAGFFKYFQRNLYMNNAFSVPEFLWTYDPRPIQPASYPGMSPLRTSMTAMGGELYYVQDDGVTGFEVWKTNGTTGGTSLLRDINNNANRESRGGHLRIPTNLITFGGSVYFNAYSRANGFELYKSDGTSNGTNLLLDIFTGTSNGDPRSGNPQNLTVLGSTMFFTATNGNGTELWKTDGTPSGTVMVADIATGSASSSPANLTVVGTDLFFSAASASGDRELYRCAAPGYNTATLVRDINPSGSSSPENLFAHDGRLFFTAIDGVTGRELWKLESPFNSGACTLVRNIWTSGGNTGNSTPKNFFSYGSRLLFAANDSTNGAELWSSVAPYDQASTTMLVNIHTTALTGSFPNLFTQVGDTVFFRAQNSTGGFELWKTGGTAASTRRVADINSGTGSSSPMQLTAFEGRLWFSANNGSGGRDLYYTSTAPFVSVTRLEIAPGSASSDPVNMRVANGRLFFTASDITNGFELWSVASGSTTPTRVFNVSKTNSPAGWRNISKGPDYTNLTGNSNPYQVENPGFDWDDPDTWTLLRGGRDQINLAGIGDVTPSFDNKQIYINTQTGSYRWIGSGWEWILSIREGFSIFPTNNGLYISTRSGIRRINGAVTSTVGNQDFYPTCVHSRISNIATPNDGRTLYCTKFDMINPAVCGWGSGQGALFGIFRCRINEDKPGSTRNIALSSGGYIGGTGQDLPVGVGWGGRPGPNPARKADLFVAGNFETTLPALKNRLPAQDITFNSGGYVTTTSAKAVLYRYNAATDTLKQIIYLGTNSTDRVHDFEYINERPAPGIGRRMAVVGNFGLVVLDSAGRLLWHKANSALPGTQTADLQVDIDYNGHVVVMRPNSPAFSHPFLIYDENGNQITGVTTGFRQFAHDIAIRNDTVIITGFRNGCLPSTPPYCNGGGGNTGGCGGAEIQTAYIFYYRKGASASDPMVLYGKTYDFPDGAQGRDIADTRGYLLNFGADGKLYFAGESAGSETIYRWPGIENSTVELNSVRLGLCDGTSLVPNGSLSTAGMRAVMRRTDLSNTASAHIVFYGQIDYRRVTPGGYCEVMQGEMIIPRNSDGKSNTFKISGKDGYITADAQGQVYVLGNSAFKFAGRDAQKVNGQEIGIYNGDLTILVTNPNFGSTRFWGTLATANPVNGRSGTGNGRQIAVLDTLVAYVAEIDTNTMATYAPTQSMTQMGLTRTKQDGYLAIFHSDLSKFANRDSIIETVRAGDTIIPPDFSRLAANFTTTRTTVCQVGAASNTTTAFALQTVLLDPTRNPGWRWNVRWDFGSGAQVTAGQLAFNGTVNNQLTGYTPPTVRWTTTGLKTVWVRVVGFHATFDSVVLAETKFNFINVFPPTVAAQSLSGPSSTCAGGVAEYRVTFDQNTAFGITNYTWTVPAGATILAGNGGPNIRVRFGSTSGNVSVVATIPCGTSTPISRTVTIAAPVRDAFMLVGSLALTPGETAVRNELISRGFNVTMREDNDYDTLDFFCRNLIVVTPTVDSALVGNRLRRIATPIIIMNPRLLPSMAMTAGGSGNYGLATNQRQINVTNSGPNDLLGGMTTGLQTVLAGNIGRSFGWGNPNANAVRIASIPGNSAQVAYFAFESGAVMNNSYAAPARRVFFFPGERLAIDSLNTLGRTLVGRTICWATNSCNIPLITAVDFGRRSFFPFDSLSIRFTSSGTFNAGNTFTIQWSDRFGDFSNATNTTVGPVQAGANPTNRLIQNPMPTLPAGTQYAVRIVSSNPATFSNAITGITLFDPLTGPDKIIYLTNRLGPGDPLDFKDTAAYAALGHYGMPTEYCRINDINAARLAGAKLIVVSPLVNTGSGFDATWSLLRSVNIPILAYGLGSVLEPARLNMMTNTGYPRTHNISLRQVFVAKDTLWGAPFSGAIPFYNDGVVNHEMNYVSRGPSGTRVLAHNPTALMQRQGLGKLSPMTTDSAFFAVFFNQGDLIGNGLVAPAHRLWLGVRFDSENRYPFLTWQMRSLIDRMIRQAIGQPAVEINRASVANSASLCTGSDVNISLQHTGRFADNNQYLVELSGPGGRFDEPGYPVLLTTEDSPLASSISVRVPTGLPSSNLYRVRLRTSRPVREYVVQDTALSVLVDDITSKTRSSNRASNINGDYSEEYNDNAFTYYRSEANARFGHTYMRVTGSDVTRWVRFTPTLPVSGTYQVRVMYPSLANAPNAAQFRVVHTGGTSTVNVNQTLNGGRWVSLGNFNFNAGTTGYLEVLANQTNLALDAVLFVRNYNAPAPAPPAADKGFSIGNVWTGAVSSDWHNPANWSLCDATSNGIPDTNTVAVIPTTLANPNNFPIVSNGDAMVKRLVVNSGDAKLWVRNGRTLRVTEFLTNEDTLRFFEGGTIIGSGTRQSRILNSAVVIIDAAAHYKAHFENSGILVMNNYAGTDPIRFHQITNSATGTFLTRGSKTINVTEGLMNNFRFSLAAGTIFNGNITQQGSIARDTINNGCVINGDFNVLTGVLGNLDEHNVNLFYSGNDQTITFNGNVNLGASVSSRTGRNSRTYMVCTGAFTNSGRFSWTNGTNGLRQVQDFQGEFVNNGVFQMESSPGGDPGIRFRRLINNGLLLVTNQPTGNEHIYLGGDVVNNGVMELTSSQGHILEFDNITNSGQLQMNKSQIIGRSLINNVGGTVTVSRLTSTIQRTVINILNIENGGTMTLGDYNNSSNGGGYVLQTHNLLNRAGGTMNIGLVSGAGTNTGRTVIAHGDFINDGTLTLNADLNMASKMGRRQVLRGVSSVANLTVSNTSTAADTGTTVQFDLGMRNLLYGNWSGTNAATRIGDQRWSSAANAYPDSAVLMFQVPVAGQYHVEVFSSTFTDRALTVPHNVFANGTWSNFTVNQRTQGNPWHRITTTPLQFRADGTEKIVIGGRPHTDGSFGADAVRIIYVGGGTFPTGGGVQLGSPLTVTGTLNLESNKLYLGTSNLTLASGAAITNANSSRYIVTNNSPTSGRLIRTVNTTEVLFPVGVDASYSPVAVNNAGNQAVSVNVLEGVRQNVSTGSYVSENVVDRTWVVSPTALATGATVRVQWNGPGNTPNNEVTGFNRSGGAFSLLSSNNTTWANAGTPTLGGADPYTAQLTGTALNPDQHLAVSSGALVSQDRVWNGSVSNAWNTAANWTPSGAPTQFAKATIPGGVPNNPLIGTGVNAVALEIDVTDGTLNMNGGTLTVNGHFRRRNTGTVNLTGGTVIMAGASASSIIGGSTFANLTITNGSGVTLPNATTTVNNITLASTGVLNFSADSASTVLNVTGLWDNSQGGRLNNGPGVLAMTGSAIQELRGINKFGNLAINNSNGVLISATDTVVGTLSLQNGNLVLGNFNLVMDGPSANITGGSASSYIQTSAANAGGIVQWRVGATERVFPVGTNSFTPLALNNGMNRKHNVRVFNGLLSDAITGTAITEKAVNRTWYVEPDYSDLDMIIDNTNPAMVYVDSTLEGTVGAPTTTGPGINTSTRAWGGTFWQFGVNNNSCRDEIRVAPTFGESGFYEVFVFFPEGSNSNSTPHIIRHADGITTINVNQQLSNGRWFSLGVYRFNAGLSRNHGSLRLPVASGGGTRYVDAVRFNFRGSTGSATQVKLTWNSGEELSAFNPSRVRMGAHTGAQNGWLFQNNISISGTNPRTATTNNVGTFPYLCIGGWGVNTWVGGIDSSWTNPGNWSIALPTSDDDIVIPATVNSNRGPRIGAGDVAWARSLTLAGGTNGRLRISGGVLNLAGNFTNNGVLNHTDGKVIITGTVPAEITGANTFRRLEIRNGSGVSLPTSTTVVSDSFIVNNGTMTMNGGVLTVNGPVRLRSSNSRLQMNDGLLVVRGNFDNVAGGIVQSSSTAGAIEFAGTGAQTVSGNSFFRNLTISNTSTAGVTFTNMDSLVVTRDLVVNANARFTMNTGKLVVQNNLIGNGIMTLTGSNTVFRGTAAQTILGSPSFGDVTIDKLGGTLAMPVALSTTGTFNLNAGNITLANNAFYNVRNLRIGALGNLTLTGGTLGISGDYDNRLGGNFTQSAGVVAFNGTTRGNILGNASFTDVQLNKTGTVGNDTLVAAGTTTITGALTLTRGYIHTRLTGLLELGPNATMSQEGNFNRVVGTLTQNLNVNGSVVNFGGNMLSINPGTEALGLVEFRRISGLARPNLSYATAPDFPSSKSIDVIWTIEPTTQPTNPVQFTVRWPSLLDNGNNRGINMYAWRRPAPYTGSWVKNALAPITLVDGATTITATQFSQWTINDENNPLPVELASFNGAWNEKSAAVDLTWVTVAERNNSHFIVERSSDQHDWVTVGTVRGRGTIFTNTRYNLSDPAASLGLNYYRLTQVDLDGTVSKLNTIAVMVGKVDGGVRMYPNPTHHNLMVEAYGVQGESLAIVVTDVLGRTVLTAKAPIPASGVVQHRLDMSSLAAGMYVVKTIDAEGNAKTAMIERK